MNVLLKWMARIAGIAGLALMAVAVFGRVSGAYYLGAFQIGTILQVGMAAALVACLGYLAVLAER
jgi:hypothetical protein